MGRRRNTIIIDNLFKEELIHLDEMTPSDLSKIRGIPVIDFDRGCTNCKFKVDYEYGKEDLKCLKGVSYNLWAYSCIFCNDFKFEKDQNLFGLWKLELTVVFKSGVTPVSSDEYGNREYRHHQRCERRDGESADLFIALESIKDKSSPEAKKIRREMRRIGIKLRPRKEKKQWPQS